MVGLVEGEVHLPAQGYDQALTIRNLPRLEDALGVSSSVGAIEHSNDKD